MGTKKFQCPHCGGQHLTVLDQCPETGEPISEVHKLEGTVLADRYRLERRLSEGGMGVVYEGRHVKLGRRVAVKLLHPYLRVSSETMKRFENEARLAASIGHQCVVDVIDLGRHQGLPYFVMEYLDGEALSDILSRDGTLGRTEAVDIAMDVLSGLNAVHARGIIHRDLKPGNIMLVTQPGGSRVVKILDFGICRLQDQSKDSLHLTKTGSVFGTPRYMSPEQAKGKKGIDHRADLYAVGILLYRMITGTFPFDGDNYNALLNAIANDEPVPPSRQTPGIPDGLEAIILRSISKNPDDRYQGADEFSEALANYSSQPPVVTAGQATLRRIEGSEAIPQELRPTFQPPAAVEATPPEGGESTGTRTSWDRTSGKRWSADFTWILPVAIVLLLALAGITAFAMFLTSRVNRQQQELEQMSRVISTKQRADDFAPQTGAGGSARNGDGTAAAGDGNPEGSGSAATGPDGRERARFDVGGLPEEAVVFLDGEPLPQLPVLVEISDVPRTLRVEAPGWIPFEKTVTIPGETKITIEMEKAPGSKKKGGKPSVEEPPIDTTYPAVVRKKN